MINEQYYAGFHTAQLLERYINNKEVPGSLSGFGYLEMESCLT